MLTKSSSPDDQVGGTSRPQAERGDRPYGNPFGTRSVAMGRRGMIATSQPLASSAGLDVLRRGGNAVDAAVTAAAVLSVVEPAMTGIGGDLFAIVHDSRTGRMDGLNASGPTGRAAACDRLIRAGHSRMPARGPLSVTVPGAVDGWSELLARHGTLTLAQALAPAIGYAGDGFPVCEIVAGQWQSLAPVLAKETETSAVFLPGGRAPRPGEIFANPMLARSLEQVAAGGRDAFYRGPIARAICRRLAERDGLVDEDDFAAFRADWVEPIRSTFRGSEVFELPPNTQGFVVLEMLNILEGTDLRVLGHNSAAYLHLLAEAKRIAFADRDHFLADPDHVDPAVLATLISKEYAAERRRSIDMSRAAVRVDACASGRRGDQVVVPPAGAGDTVYLTAVDGSGLAISLIQSLFEPFGSGVVPAGTGILLHSRGSLFTLDPGHPNALGPRKRPLHTLIPAMVTRDGRLWLSFGVMGGDLQPQGHVQVLMNLIEFGMTIQEAGEAARIRHSTDGVAVESGISEDARAGLAARGHRVIESPGVFGGFQGIQIDRESGVLMGGSDPRKDGLAIGY
jgi:gamma-glutamyltranspeptidase / glutathione hydrolase